MSGSGRDAREGEMQQRGEEINIQHSPATTRGETDPFACPQDACQHFRRRQGTAKHHVGDVALRGVAESRACGRQTLRLGILMQCGTRCAAKHQVGGH